MYIVTFAFEQQFFGAIEKSKVNSVIQYGLFTEMKDINTSPNSFLINTNVAILFVNQSDFEKIEKVKNAKIHRAIELCYRTIGMQDDYVFG